MFLERIDELDRASSQRLQNIAESLLMKLDEHMRNERDVSAPKPARKAILKKLSPIENQKCLDR